MARGRKANGSSEQSPLLQDSRRDEEQDEEPQVIDFDKEDSENPKHWTKKRKLANVGIIALMAILSPLASSMFTPAIPEIAEDLKVEDSSVVAATTGFVVMLGVGPLILAPLSETFGRRILYLICFGLFSLLQIPTALSPNFATLIACRTLAGFFGSVGIANGGGTISDMFDPSERAGIFGWYLLGPLLGPTIGPLGGGLIVKFLHWRWMFWILGILAMVNTAVGYFFLRETYAPAILQARCNKLEAEEGGNYTYEGRDERPLPTKIGKAVTRPLKILFTQPIVFTMASYQAVIFATMYTLFTTMNTIFSNPPYNFDQLQVGALFIGPGSGFLVAVWFLIPYIDIIFNRMTKQADGEQKPEFRLPLANVGSVLLPLTLFWFGWCVNFRVHWLACIAATPFFGLGQVAIFNTFQNYYIDAFQQYAASAIAAGALFRSFIGGVVPLFAPAMFEKLGYGWGWSVFGFATLLLSPSPLLFMRYGERLRHRFQVDL